MRNLLFILFVVAMSLNEATAQKKALLVRSNGSTRWGKIYLKKGNKLLYKVKQGSTIHKSRIKQITKTSFIMKDGKEVMIADIEMVKFMFPLEKALGYGFGWPIFSLGLAYIAYPLYDANTSKGPAGFLRSSVMIIIGTGLVASSYFLIFQKHRFEIPGRWRIVIEKKRRDKS